MPSTPYHETVRGAVAVAVRAQLVTAGVTLMVYEWDELIPQFQNQPSIVVVYGSEFNSGEGTNIRDAVAYPLLVAFLTKQYIPGSPPAGCSVALFREIVHDACHNRRLSGLDTSALPAHVDPQPPQIDPNVPGFEDVKTSPLVTVTALRPRGA